MTILKCSAVTCIYNENMLCSRGEIDVIGENAHHSSETSCGSFRDQKDESMKNGLDHHCGCKQIHIACQAQNCTYNEDCKCTAGSVDVDGEHACDCRETQCCTFTCKG